MQIYFKTGFNLGRNKKNLTISMYILENLKAIRECIVLSESARIFPIYLEVELN